MRQKRRSPLAFPGSLAAISLLLIGVVAMTGALAVPPPVVRAAAPCDGPYNPPFNPADFKDEDGEPFDVDNPYFPLEPGTTFTYEAKVDGEVERDVVHVTRDTKTILGVRAVVVRDRVTVDGKLVELTFDWFAQDKRGNVWYLGEYSTDYDPDTGKVVSHQGSWEAGKDGAKPGIIMEAQPKVGDTYRQEYARGVAEDAATVLSLSKRVSVPHGSFDHVLQTKDFSCIPGVPDQEHKYYARGVGMVLTVKLEDGKETRDSERLRLISVKTTGDSDGDSGDSDGDSDDDSDDD